VPGIDDKVVAMSFESSKFEQGVNSAIRALEKLKASLKFPNSGKELNEINAAAKRVDLGHIAKGVDDVKNRLNALRLVAVAVFAQIASRAIAAGSQFLKAFTIGPLIQGFQEYSTNLNAIQTILANTQAAGTNLQDVNRALQELNRYSDKTIYNFSQMARNIGTFTAAGVQLDVATGAIKGIANLAALSGSNADQASTAMYQLSQAIAAGSVKLQDWNSVVNAGMGGTVFQRALAMNAEKIGTLKDGAVKLTGAMKNVTINGEAFRQSLSTPGKPSWLTSKVLTSTLEQFTGDLSDAQLAAEGFNKAEIAAIQKTAQTAMHAATEVKTISQVFEVAKETAGSGWAKTFQIIFGNFKEAKKTFTDLSNTINGFINRNAQARNKVLADWKALGGRTVLIEGIKSAFQNLGAVLKPIKQAFRDIFPASTGKSLFDLTTRFKNFADSLKPTPTTVENLRRTFRGLFALLDIGKQVIGGIFSVFGHLFGAVGQGTGGFLSITASIGDFLVKVDESLKKGGRLADFFDDLGNAIAAPIQFIGELINSFEQLFSGGVSKQVAGMTQSLSPLEKILAAISQAWDNFVSSFGDVGNVFTPVIQAFVDGIQQLGPAVAQAISGMSFEPILQVIRTGLLAGIFVLFKNFLGKGSFLDQIGKGFAGGIIGNIAGSFNALQGSLQAMQTNIKAKTLKEIAIAVALLAASVVALSFVKPEKLDKAMSAITIMLAQLLGAMKILDKITATSGFVRLPVVAASLILLAGAIDVLALAVVGLSFLSWGALIKGLGGVSVLLVGMVAATGPLSKASPRLIVAGAGITAIAVALNILALAVRQFGTMGMATLSKGLGAVAAGLVIIAGAMRVMPTGMVAQSAALIVIATSLRILGEAVQKLGSLNWKVIAKGLGAIGIALGIIAAAMHLMPTSMIATAAGLVLVSAALQGIARAVENMGAMSMEEIAKGLGALAGALAILAGGLYLIEGTAGGAAALGVAAAGIALLVPPLILLGKQKIKTLVVGLIALAAIFGVIAAAALALAPSIPVLLGFGAAVALVGAGLALAGAGVALIGIGLAAIAASGSVAVGVLIQAFIDLQKALVENAKLIVLGLLEIVKAFADTAPQFVAAVVKILDALIQGLIQLAPQLVPLITTLITVMIQVLNANQARLIQAGFDLLIALLVGIRNNITEVVRLAIQIIQEFADGVAKNINKIISAGVQIMSAFIKGIVSGAGKIATAGLNAVVRFLGAIASGLGRVAAAGLNIMTSLIRGIANGVGRAIKAGTNAVVAFINGIGSAGARVITAGTNTIIKLINALQSNANRLADAGAKAIIAFLNGLANTINARAPEMRQAGIRVGEAILNGMLGGLTAKAQEIYNKIGEIVSNAKRKLEVWHSPPSAYGEWLGQQVVLGLANGLSDSVRAVDAAGNISKSVIATFTSIFQTASPSKVMYAIGKDVIAGFAQGLKAGTEEDIRNAFQAMNQQIGQRLSELRQTIRDEKAKIRELRKGKETKEEKAEIDALTLSLKLHELQLTKVTNAQALLNKGLKANKAELIKHAQEYAALIEKIDKIKGVIADLKAQYADLPDISATDEQGNTLTGAEQLAKYTESLTNQVAAVKKYNETLQQLRALGLDDATYQMLLDKGTSGEQFAEALLAGGKPAIDSVNALDSDLDTAAGALGENAAANLYNAGIKAAEGLVAGLESQKAQLEQIMNDLADEMVARIKRKLKIKSPSEVFAELGKLSMEGMAQGFTNSSKVVTDAIEGTADDALSAMEESMRNLSDVAMNEIDANPVITPVLDLTQVQRSKNELARLMDADKLAAGVSSTYAASISADQSRLAEEKAIAANGASFSFEQNNYSPEALSNIEIYRQTKNQLSQIKAALALN